jgi:phage antirepressor YoqD-like protein
MNTATVERTKSSIESADEAKALLLKRFIARMDKKSKSELIRAASLDSDDRAFALIITKTSKAKDKALSIKARNEIAVAQLKTNAFEAVKSTYDLLDAGDVCQILGISKQALSKKTKAGQVIAYTNNRRKYYPDFQFENNKVASSTVALLKELAIDPEDESKTNVLIGFLAKSMDFSNPGDSKNVQPRYKFLDDEAALKIIIRDFKNRLEMGK